MEDYKYDGVVIECPYCGAKVTIMFDTARCHECGWSLSENEIEDVMEEY